MENEIISQLTSAAIVVYALQWLKRTPLVVWITPNTKRINRLLSAIGASLSAVGIHFAFDAARAADGTFVVTITGLTIVSVLHGLWHVANSYALQQLMYDAVAKQSAPAAMPPALPGEHV